MTKFLLLLALSLGALCAHATEVDNITSYYESIADSEAVLNSQVQILIEQALAGQRDCNRQALARRASGVLIGNIIFGTIERFANTSSKVARSYTPVEKSIYHGTPYQGGIVDLFVNLGPTVNVAGHHVGTDKLGHFFDMGYDLYKRSLWGVSVKGLLRQSRREQGGLWGLYMTGVKSYGDIAANFDGYRFWTNFIEVGPRQYFTCESGKLKQVRYFRWSDYISSAWNEAINCSEYWSEDFASTINRNVRALEDQAGHRYACPIVPDQCNLLREIYARWIPLDLVGELVSPLCR